MADDPQSFTIDETTQGLRVDHFLTQSFDGFSRTHLQRAIKEGGVLLNGSATKPGHKLRAGDQLSVVIPPEAPSELPAEKIDLDVLYEDGHLVIINKPHGLIVHPGRGNYSGTLASGLQFHFDQLSDAAGELRPGIVHRLDRDTSGVLVVAKNNQIHHQLSAQFEQRTVQKEYCAIVWGEVEFDSDWIETHIRVHPKQREKMQVCGPGGEAREAITFFEVLERFPGFSYVKLTLKTGRTHQLRVHMQHLGHSIVADKMYGGHAMLLRKELGLEPADKALIKRQALHARKLTVTHPVTGEPLTAEAPIPEDMQRTLDALRAL
ncbi:RluA family pseudouridine synthase [Calycomorphotria hydatis]|uniref:Pseudouridine synthase n=1 Tax=Calycomorphotria hydatis TaxID=2528027 RepID=A0A517TBF1_9PLAN|nr:RluA family pseudouridine synthase [Calycomorphotria hydatis]QDT65695.1 Pseudouridine synthase [Calycomorphotria hydatis]